MTFFCDRLSRASSCLRSIFEDEQHRTALVSFLFATLFMLPFLLSPRNAGFIYTGDIYHSWMPEIIKLGSLISHGIFAGMDYSTHSGSSEFFLRPNMIIYHPVAILLAALTGLPNMGMVSLFLVLACYLHFFAGCFFGIRVARDMFHFDFPIAVFIAVFYTFSLYIQRNIGFPPFVFIATLFPAIIYAGYASWRNPGPLTVLFASIPIVVSFLAGYIAIALASVFFAALFLLAWFLVIRKEENLFPALMRAYLPFVVASLVALPYYVAVFSFHAHTEAHAGMNSVFASAHQLAENPRTILRLFSEGLIFVGKLYEQSIYVGIVPFTLLLLALFNPWIMKAAEPADRRSMILNALIFVFFVLIMFGDHSVVSDMFYYLMPGIGTMHIYQRYLVFAQLGLGLLCGHALQLFLDQEYRRTPGGRAVVVGGLLLALVAAALFVNYDADGYVNDSKTILITDALVFDLIIAAFVFAIWHFTNSVRLFVILATIAVFLVPANRLYDFRSTEGYDRGIQGTKHLEVNSAYYDQVARYLGQDNDKGKALVRLLNTEPGVTAAFASLNLPWYLLPRAAVSDYLGYDFGLSEPLDYRHLFPIFANKDNLLQFRFDDHNWLEYTGLDYVLYKPSMLKTNPDIAGLVDASNPKDMLVINDDLVIAPTHWHMAHKIDPAIDNGYFHIDSTGGDARITEFKTNGASWFNLKVTAEKPAVLHYLFWKNKHISFHVDGKRVEPTIKDDRYVGIDIPAGDHVVTVCYLNIPLVIFLIEYLLYALAVLVGLACLHPTARVWVEKRLQPFCCPGRTA